MKRTKGYRLRDEIKCCYCCHYYHKGGKHFDDWCDFDSDRQDDGSNTVVPLGICEDWREHATI